MRLDRQQISKLKGGIEPFKRPHEEEAASFSFRIFDKEITNLENNLQVAARTITYTVARAVAFIGVDLLTKALPRTPIDPAPYGGRLRQSGTVSFFYGWSGESGYSVDIAKGKKDAVVDVDMSKISVRRLTSGKAVRKFDAVVHFFRENADGDDIALWTHESLMPYSERNSRDPNSDLYYARTSGTGPKYLEIPFLQSYDDYVAILKDAVYKDSIDYIRLLSRGSIKVGRGKYSVDNIELVMNRINTLGYYR